MEDEAENLQESSQRPTFTVLFGCHGEFEGVGYLDFQIRFLMVSYHEGILKRLMFTTRQWIWLRLHFKTSRMFYPHPCQVNNAFLFVVVTQFFHTLSLFRFHLFRKSDCIWSPEPGAKLQFNTFNSDEKWQIKMTHVANLIPKNVSRCKVWVNSYKSD